MFNLIVEIIDALLKLVRNFVTVIDITTDWTQVAKAESDVAIAEIRTDQAKRLAALPKPE